MSSARALIVDDVRFERHISPPGHPERPERLAAARHGLAGVRIDWTQIAARPAIDQELALAHDPRFIEKLERLRGRSTYIDADTFVSPETVDIARLASGSAVALIDALMEGPVTRGIALLRPPGHHAGPARAMGFCLLNNVAVAAAHGIAHGLERVAVVDWDVHHGNGTQDIFWRDPRVLYISTHQFPLYPGTGGADEVGAGEGTGFTVNIPLPAGSRDSLYAGAFRRIVLPVLEAYAPQMILVSAGFDAAARDPLGQMELSADAFGWMARELGRVADRTAGGKMALLLEGGYDLASIEAGLRSAAIGALLGEAAEIPAEPDHEALEVAARAARAKWTQVG